MIKYKVTFFVEVDEEQDVDEIDIERLVENALKNYKDAELTTIDDVMINMPIIDVEKV